MISMMRSRVIPVLLLLLALPSLAQRQPIELQLKLTAPFRFVAYGDTRFTDPKNAGASNAAVRKALVQAIADAHPAFVSIGGDLTFRGDDPNDWKTWNTETAIWAQRNIPVYPALGNHDLRGDEKRALANYFEHFPELQENRYYSLRVANSLMIVLDSSLDETLGSQGEWLQHKLDTLPDGIDFVFLVLHHPPYTSSSDGVLGGGHAARRPEHLLANMLEERQRRTHARFVVFAGHVHNYERQEHNGVTYFVTGGGGAHPYFVKRSSGDLFQGSSDVNYHYLLVEVDHGEATVTMNRIELNNGKATWAQPDHVKIMASSR